jgi:hypothetical protein
MVFDTRGRRKHVVRVVYAILALLMGASLFLVVGPFNIASLIGGSSSSNTATVLNEQAERTERKLRTEPGNEGLLLSLSRTRSAAANALTEVSSATGVPSFTAEGVQELNLAIEAWNKYLKLSDEPSPSGALLMAGTFFSRAQVSANLEEIEENLAGAAESQKIAAQARPSVGTYSNLAIYEYYRENFAAGDAAAKKAAAKAPGAEAKEVTKKLSEYRARGKAFEQLHRRIEREERESGKEALQNPLGTGLSAPGGSLGQ